MAKLDGKRHPLAPLCKQWLSLIKVAQEKKHREFGQFAEEAMKFYDGAHDFMWDVDKYATAPGGFLDKDSGTAMPTFRMTVNRLFEAVALFGPALFHKYPQVVVNAIEPPEISPESLGFDQADEAGMQQYQQIMAEQAAEASRKKTMASLKQRYLNWLQVAANKKKEARESITETLIKGMGVLWTEMRRPRGSRIQYPASVHVSCDDIVKDPDAEYDHQVEWIARRCVHAVNRVEEKYGLPAGSLRGSMQSLESQSTAKGRKDAKSGKQDTTSYDLIEYWEIYSKNGMGDRLKGAGEGNKVKYDLSEFGDFCYLAVVKDVPYPLNMPTEMLERGDSEELFQAAQWPIPFWTDEECSNGWPYAELSFYHKPKSVWPISPVKPAIGELRFVNWCMSFLADKAAASCKTYMGVMKSAAEEIRRQIADSSGPFTIIEISEIVGQPIDEIVSMLSAPDMPDLVWKMATETLEFIDKRLGTTDLIYGLSSTQMRSAAEAQTRDANTQVRPDEMANRVEDWLSESAMKEAEAAIWMLTHDDVVPVLGELGAHIFETQIQTTDFDQIVRDFDYTIAAGSARKPNKAQRIASLNEFGQMFLPVASAMAESGQVGPYNAFIEDMCRALDLPEPQRYQIDQPQASQGPSPEEMDAQAKQQEMQQSAQQHEQEMAQSQQKFQQEMTQEKAQHRQQTLFDQQDSKIQLQTSKAMGAAKVAQAKKPKPKPVAAKA
jgi:hypothetical protein